LTQVPAQNELWICPYCTALLRQTDKLAAQKKVRETPH
jgi:hypothetical protein